MASISEPVINYNVPSYTPGHWVPTCLVASQALDWQTRIENPTALPYPGDSSLGDELGPASSESSCGFQWNSGEKVFSHNKEWNGNNNSTSCNISYDVEYSLRTRKKKLFLLDFFWFITPIPYFYFYLNYLFYKSVHFLFNTNAM